MAAVLATGPGAVLGYRSAAELWGIRGGGGAIVEVVTPDRTRAHPRVTLRRSRLAADERTVEAGIPVTTPARTLFDLAVVLNRDRLERAVHEAEVRRLLSPVGLPALLERHPGRRGAKALRAVLSDLTDHGPAPTRSELEDRFLAVLRERGLPRPLTNHGIPTGAGTFWVDAAWPGARLVGELDSRRFHADRRSFENDRLRDRALAVAGWRVVRITWLELRARPERVGADLERLLAAPAHRPPGQAAG